jgi:GNAT superfamily N-acetyltransferase
MSLKILIDTNIFIQLEEPDNTGFLRSDFAEFSRLAKKHGVSIFCHPESEEDLKHDENTERRQKSLLNYSAYPKLENPPTAEAPELEALFKGINNSNDFIDCQILYSLQCNCTEFLISQDGKIRSRAKYAGLNNRLFSIKEAVIYLKSLFEPTELKHPHVDELHVYSLKDDEPIFKSLAQDYEKFDIWLAKCKTEHRKAWTVKVEDKIAGIVIRKDENAELEYPGLGNKCLKLCTFKVEEDFRGSKLGELLLKNVFGFCLANNYDSTYLTAFTKHDYLIEFLKDFGFEVRDKPNKNGELVFYKKFYKSAPSIPRIDPLDFSKKYAPFIYGDESIGKYVIPIRPEFHNLFFPELVKQQQLMPTLTAQSIPGNTIKKVYLCHANISTIKRGDLVLFYRSEDSEVTTIGIVERVLRTNNLSEALRQIGKRSVYTFDQIKEMIARNLLIIDFRLVTHLEHAPTLKELKENKVLVGPPQSITTLDDKKFEYFKSLLPALL